MAKKLKFQLTIPLCVLDIETDGLDTVNNEILSFSATRFNTDGTVKKLNFMCKPSKPIPAFITKINNITNEMVADKPSFDTFVSDIVSITDGAIIGGFNNENFDVPFIKEQLKKAGVKNPLQNNKIIDSFVLYKKHSGRKLSDAVRHYLGEDIVNAHNAEGDVESTIAVLSKQLEVENKTIDEIVNEPVLEKAAFQHILFIEKEPYINFGKYKGIAVKDVDIGFLKWILKSDFKADVKKIIKEYV